MSADIINLRQARKRKARNEAEAKAAQNRVSFGLTKSERHASTIVRESTTRGLDGHKLPTREPDDG